MLLENQADPALRGVTTEQFRAQARKGKVFKQELSVGDVLDDAREVLRVEKSKASALAVHMTPRAMSAVRLNNESAIDNFELPSDEDDDETAPQGTASTPAAAAAAAPPQQPAAVAAEPQQKLPPQPQKLGTGKRARRLSLIAPGEEAVTAGKQPAPTTPQQKRFGFLEVGRLLTVDLEPEEEDEAGGAGGAGDPHRKGRAASFLTPREASRAGKQLDLLRALDHRQPTSVLKSSSSTIAVGGEAQAPPTPRLASVSMSADLLGGDGGGGGGASCSTPRAVLPKLQLSQARSEASVESAEGGLSSPRTAPPRTKSGLPMQSALTPKKLSRHASQVSVGTLPGDGDTAAVSGSHPVPTSPQLTSSTLPALAPNGLPALAAASAVSSTLPSSPPGGGGVLMARQGGLVMARGGGRGEEGGGGRVAPSPSTPPRLHGEKLAPLTPRGTAGGPDTPRGGGTTPRGGGIFNKLKGLFDSIKTGT